jgi:hypothetical protein
MKVKFTKVELVNVHHILRVRWHRLSFLCGISWAPDHSVNVAPWFGKGIDN